MKPTWLDGPRNYTEATECHERMAAFRDWERRHPHLARLQRRLRSTRLGWWLYCRGWLGKRA